jgi:hypothetical protein
MRRKAKEIQSDSEREWQISKDVHRERRVEKLKQETIFKKNG